MTAEIALAGLGGFIIQDPEDRLCSPSVLENHVAPKQRILLKVKKHAEVMEVAAEFQGFVVIGG
jgi:hypothetical protein